MDIPPPPPPPPAPDDSPGPPPPPQPAPEDAPGPPAPPPPAAQDAPGPPPPPPPPYPQPPYGPGPYGSAGPYPGAPYGGPHPYPPYPPYPYGPAPYPGGPQGWYPVDRSWNGMAIASFVLAVTCIPLLGVVFGVIALRQIGRRGQQGKGLAVAGLVVSAVWTTVTALLVAAGLAGLFHEGNTRVEDIKVGDCFNTVGNDLSDYGNKGVRSTTVDVVPCELPHDAEAFAHPRLDPSLGPDYPGTDRLADIAGSQCADAVDSYTGGAAVEDNTDIYYYMPPRDGWARGDRWVTCFFGGTDGKLTGSVRSGPDRTDVGV